MAILHVQQLGRRQIHLNVPDPVELILVLPDKGADPVHLQQADLGHTVGPLRHRDKDLRGNITKLGVLQAAQGLQRNILPLPDGIHRLVMHGKLILTDRRGQVILHHLLVVEAP